MNIKYKISNYLRVIIGSLVLFFVASRKNDINVSDIDYLSYSDNDVFTAVIPEPFLSIGSNALILSLVSIIFMAIGNIRYLRINNLSINCLLYSLFILIFNANFFDESNSIASFAGIIVGLCLMLISFRPSSPDGFHRYSLDNFCILLIYFFLVTVINFYFLVGGYGYSSFRFSGISYHPNALGQMIAIPSIVWLYLSRANIFSLKLKLLSTLLFLMSTFLVLASASRGALATYLFGIIFLLIFFRKDYKKYLLFIPITPILYIGYHYFEASNFSAVDRLFTAGDNRSDSLEIMWNTFIENPIFGSSQGAGASENAILKALGSTGIFGGLFFILFISLAIKNVSKAINQKSLPKYIYDKNNIFVLVISLVLFSSLFEGYMVERLSLSGFIVVYSLLGIYSGELNISSEIKKHMRL